MLLFNMFLKKYDRIDKYTETNKTYLSSIREDWMAKTNLRNNSSKQTKQRFLTWLYDETVYYIIRRWWVMSEWDSEKKNIGTARK